MTSNIETGLVSTIIPVFNRPKMIVESVNSVLEQTYRPIEIIIVNDGSSDETPQVLQQLQAQHTEVRIFSQKNGGPGAARETGRQHARGEFIQYHDSDDLLCVNKFQDQVAALIADPEADVAYGKTELRQLGEPLKQLALKGTGQKREAMFPALLRSRWWSTSTPLHRRSVTDRAGPWMATKNEEDWEYDCRIASLGGRLVYVDEFVSITQSHNAQVHIGGTHEPQKLIDRCRARAEIAHHAQRYMQLANRPSDILSDDWHYFSKSVFLLARECAAVGLIEYAQQMFNLSISVIGKPTVQHALFKLLVGICGWSVAAKLLRLLGK